VIMLDELIESLNVCGVIVDSGPVDCTCCIVNLLPL
jgi:hypothetical protein